MAIRVSGKVSWFGGPHDSMDSGHTASGGTTATPGLAFYRRDTLGGYWFVRAPNGRTAILQQTDIGPHPSTGRSIDFTYSSLGQFGYHEGNFPTDSRASAVYLGRGVNHAHRQAARMGLVKGATVAPSRPTLSGLGPASPTIRTPTELTPGGTGLTSLIAGQQAGASASQPTAPPVSGPPMPSFSTGFKIPGGARLPMVGPPTPPADTLGQQLTQVANLRGPDIGSLFNVSGGQPQLAAPKGGKAPRGQAGFGHRYFFPIQGSHFTTGRTDNGVDYETRPGTGLVAVGNGVITTTHGPFTSPSGSIVLRLDHPVTINGQTFTHVYYGHLNDSNKKVRAGQRVTAGQIVAATSHSPEGARDMPGHTEIGFSRPDGSIFLRGHAEGATEWGNLFSGFVRHQARR